MAHFARIADDIVQEVIVVDNKDCGDVDFPESEPIGQAFIASLGLEGEWLQTSYNNRFRYWYASGGMIYDREADAFHSTSPGPDWTLDKSTYQWVNSAGNRVPAL